MADSFTFSFAGLTDYSPYTGEGGSDIIPFDGYVAVKLVSFEAYHTKDKKYPAVKVRATIEDEDAKNMRLIDDVLCGGKDKNGNDLARQFADLLVSSGTTPESIQENARKGVSADIATICGQLVGRVAYCEIQASKKPDGADSTEVSNWILKERYEQAKTIGAHRRGRRAVQAANVAGAASFTMGGAPANTNGATAGTPAPAAGSAFPSL